MPKIAIIQEPPVFLHRARTIDKAVSLVAQAAGDGAELVIFPEAFVAGYPAWIWRLRPGGDWDASEELHRRLLESSVDIGAGELAPLFEAAREHAVTIVCGVNENEGATGGTTLYNTVVVIGRDGTLLNRHRKLMPTNPERMVWGFGDATGLRVIDTPVGRVGTLLCWENYMPLARYALYAQGIELYIAPTYDSGDDWIGTLQHIAREGRCWVAGSGVVLENKDIPVDIPGREQLYPADEHWVNPGDSVVIAPGGEIVAGPLREATGMLFAEVDRAHVGLARRTLDVTGHYARPDIFTLRVDTRAQGALELGPGTSDPGHLAGEE